ncbi:hypothetical protein Bbelb_023190 [Branchiostoma belcheri]|nr:hypothetical protein Bbelb_023190 [Branchiostoma belcheri]
MNDIRLDKSACQTQTQMRSQVNFHMLYLRSGLVEASFSEAASRREYCVKPGSGVQARGRDGVRRTAARIDWKGLSREPAGLVLQAVPPGAHSRTAELSRAETWVH